MCRMAHQTPPGERLRKIRIRQRLTQKAFAKKVGCTWQSISEFENGHRPPSHPRLVKALWDETGITPTDWLAWFSEEMSAAS